MPAPTPYNRLKNFTQYQLDHPSGSYNGSDHDAEFNAVQQTVAQLVTNIQLIQRDDGLVKNLSVTPDALSTAALALIGAGNTGQLNWTPRGLWVTLTVYALGNVVEQAGTSYVCSSPHTSGTFATDKAAGKWVSLGGLIVTLAASAVTVSPTGGISSTNAQAAFAELDAEKAALAGSASQPFAVATPSTGQQAPQADDILKQTDWFLALAAAVSDTYTGTISITSLVALTDGMELPVRFPSANGGATPTLNLTLGATATGAKTLVRPDGTALIAADIAAGMEGRVRYRLSTDKWLLLNRQGPAAPGAANTVWTSQGPASQPAWQGIPAQNALAATRQAILASKLDSNGYANALAAGTGLALDLSATTTPMISSFAAGFNSSGSVDYVASLTADAASVVSALSASNTSFISQDFQSSSAVTWGKYLVPPQYGYTFDRTRGALLNFQGLNAATTTTDDFGSTWTASGNAQITTAQFKFGISCTVLDGTGDYWTSTNFTSLGDGSWELSCWFRINALPGVGSQMRIINATNAGDFGVQLGLQNTAGTTKLTVSVSSNGSSHDVVNGVGGSNTTWALNQWNKARFVFDALAGTYRIYLSLNGAAETQDQTTSSSARVCAVTQIKLGADASGASNFNGWIAAFRFLPCATNTTTETPSASAPTITDYPFNFFSIPEMKMYEVTGASGVAGTNPSMTTRNRLFVGEADTGGVSVSAVRNYAIRCSYESAFNTFTSGTPISMNHNIGVPPQRAEHYLVNATSQHGWNTGDIFPIALTQQDNSGVVNRGASEKRARTNSRFVPASGGFMLVKQSDASVVVLTDANWKHKMIASRGW